MRCPRTSALRPILLHKHTKERTGESKTNLSLVRCLWLDQCPGLFVARTVTQMHAGIQDGSLLGVGRTDTQHRPRPGNLRSHRRRQPHSRRSRRILPCRRITPVPTNTPAPTETPLPTDTPQATDTPVPPPPAPAEAPPPEEPRPNRLSRCRCTWSVGKLSCAMGAPTMASRRTSGSASPSQMRVGIAVLPYAILA